MKKKNPLDALAVMKGPPKKKKKRRVFIIRKFRTLELMLARKLAQWNDDEYDSGKDW